MFITFTKSSSEKTTNQTGANQELEETDTWAFSFPPDAVVSKR